MSDDLPKVALPPFVIIKAGTEREPIYLSQSGWTPHRAQALSFETEGGANDWIADVKANAPAFVRSAVMKAHRSPYGPGEKFVGGTREAGRDYDPIPPEDAA